MYCNVMSCIHIPHRECLAIRRKNTCPPAVTLGGTSLSGALASMAGLAAVAAVANRPARLGGHSRGTSLHQTTSRT